MFEKQCGFNLSLKLTTTNAYKKNALTDCQTTVHTELYNMSFLIFSNNILYNKSFTKKKFFLVRNKRKNDLNSEKTNTILFFTLFK